MSLGIGIEPIPIPDTDLIISAENVIDPDIVRTIIQMKNFQDRQKIYVAALEIAKSVRQKKKFIDMYNQLGSVLVATGKSSNLYGGRNPEKEWLIPSDCELDMDGIKMQTRTEGGIINKTIAPAPIFIECVITDRSDPTLPQKSAELHFFDLTSGRWEIITVPENILMDALKVKQLANAGVLFDPAEARRLVYFFYMLRVLNRIGADHPIKEYTAVNKLGWKEKSGKMLFLPYDDDEKIRFAGKRDNRIMFDSLKHPEQGDFDKWLAVAKPAVLRDRKLRIFADAAVASVLVGPTKSLPFVVHFYGGSGIGKTAALSLAASIWGPAHPMTGGYIGTWSTTKVGVETRCDLLNDLPMLLDDTAEAERAIRDFSGFIYELASGKGKMRGTKTLERQRDFRWNCVTLSTGEHPIINEDTQGGAKNRVIQLEADRPVFDDFTTALDVLYNNSGHAGRKIVEFIQEIGFDFVKKRKANYAKELNQIFGTTGSDTTKQAESLALLLAADELLATQVLTIDPLKAEDMKPFYTSLDAIDENLQAYDVLKTTVLSMRRQHFFEEVSKEVNGKTEYTPLYPTQDLWGRIYDDETDVDGDTITVDIMPRIFNRVIKDSKYDPQTFLKWLDKNNLLSHEKGRLTCRRALQKGEKKMRVYEIQLHLDEYKPQSNAGGKVDDVPDDLPY